MISKKSKLIVKTDKIDQAQGTISELYPEIARILLFAAFEEADSESEPNYQQIIFTPQSEAIFRLDCSREECVGGGFDLTKVVAEMVKNRESRVHGKLACEGTLRSGGRCCSLKADYRIIVADR
jgi:hypothetical protein